MSDFRKPLPTDPMDDHAEQHGHAYDQIEELKGAVEGMGEEYISSNDNTNITPTADNRWITLSNKRPKEEDGTFLDEEFGLEINLDEGNTYKNQFAVGSRHGYALKVLGGGGKTTWIGGKIQQKGDDTDNLSPDDYITRQNLTESTDDLQGNIDHNEDRINALEVELDLLGDTREAGEWFMSETEGVGKMIFTNPDLTSSVNGVTIDPVDAKGTTHNFRSVQIGDYVEFVESHQQRMTGDYALYKVNSVDGNSFGLVLERGAGDASINNVFLVKFFHLNEDLDLADLDSRYSPKIHSHSSVPSHTHNYASSSHSHSYAASDHSHGDAVMKSGTSNNPTLARGEMYLNTNYKVVYVGT